MRSHPRSLVILLLALYIGCGGEEDDDPPPPAPAPLTDKQEIEQTGNKWAPLFGKADPAACNYMTASARQACEVVFTPPPSGFQRTFAEATVETIKTRGKDAGSRFSNGETVEWRKSPDAPDGDRWKISNLGGNAGQRFFP